MSSAPLPVQRSRLGRGLASLIGEPGNSPNGQQPHLPPEGEQKIAALPLKGDQAQTQALLVKLLSSEPRVTLVEQNEHYLRAEFASKLMGFVDDVEFLIGPQQVDVRSASRLGYADFDVNRKRIEHLRQRMSE